MIMANRVTGKNMNNRSHGSGIHTRSARFATRLCAVDILVTGGACARDAKVDGDWTNYGRDGSEQHYSPLDEVNLKNAKDLSLAWHFDLEPGYSLATPVAAEGKLFITTGNSHIRALDAVTGKQ